MACGAIRFDHVAHARRLEGGLNLGQDRARIFGARVVAGGDDEVASLPGRGAHLGALGAVAIAPAAEEGEDAAAGCAPSSAGQGPDEIAQGVVGVRVVHDDRERLARIDGLKAPGHRLELWNGGDELIEGNVRERARL